MENKDLDSLMNDLNDELKPEDTTSPAAESSSTTTEDEILRDMLSGYNPSSKVEGWDKIAASLDTADEAFDHDVRIRIHHYHASYDPHSWPKFAQRFTDHKQLRTRLIALKLSEAAAIILLMMTMLHLGHNGKLPFQQSNSVELAVQDIQIPSTVPLTDKDGQDIAEQVIKTEASESNLAQKLKSTNTLRGPIASPSPNKRISADPKVSVVAAEGPASYISSIKQTLSGSSISSTDDESGIDVSLAIDSRADQSLEEKSDMLRSNFGPTAQMLPLGTASLSYADRKNIIHTPTLVAASNRTYIEFGMLAQADYNQLKMPEDRLNNDGEQIIFPLQGITSPGFGAGFTLALGHPRWAAETGVIYNAKTFRPGRELTIGDQADNSNVEYEAMHMQLISIPLQFRYRFDAKGRLKTYGFAGFGLHIIAQSDIDVKVDHNFPSLSAGEDPNNDPYLARTIRQAQRVSEDIRERAPFSTNSYISANLGLGIEYELLDRKTLFLQTAYQYQIPNIRFSNHNGKHVLSLSLQAGVRTPLGS